MKRLFNQRLVALAAALALWGGSVAAQPAPDGPGKAPEPSAEAVLEATLALALEGNADAQLAMAATYEELDSLNDAVRWYRKAAEQGKADAEFKLGYFYTVGGGGLAKDLAEAARWYEKAAAQNQPGAQYNLAVCCEKGLGVARDEARALSLYRRAAAMGDTYAQKAVGVIHQQGRGVKADPVEAYAWYLLAASQQNPDAARLLKDVEPTLAANDLERGRLRGAELSMQIYHRTLTSLADSSVAEKKGSAKKKGSPKDFLQ